MPAHTHDGIDWVARLAGLRRADDANAPALRAVAERLITSVPAPHPTVLDVGSGAGGMSAALARALASRPEGGELVLVDAVPELLAAAAQAATAASRSAVHVRTVRADLANVHARNDSTGALHAESDFGIPQADLVWASNVAHHLPDQRDAVAALVGWLVPGGCLAFAEGGLSMRCLPWDLGVGEPGLQDRLIAAHGTWFHRMRTEMEGAVRLPVGWNLVLREAGLADVSSFSYLVDVPAPMDEIGRAAAVSWLEWMSRATAELITETDQTTIARLLDEDDPAYVGGRDDVFLLKAGTVYLGWRR